MGIFIVWLTIFLGFTAIIWLCWYIVGKLSFIKKQKNVQHAHALDQQDKKDYLIDSLRVLARTMVDGQLEFSEGCIRIKVLMDHLDATLNKRAEFKVFETMYLATEHMPTHEERKKVDKRFIEKMDQQRFELEKLHKEDILQAAKALLVYLPPSLPPKV